MAAVREPIASFIKRVKVSSTLNRPRGNLAANNGVDSKSAVRILPDADTQRRDIFTQGSNQLFEDENGRIIPYTQPCSDMFLGTEPHPNGRSAGNSNETTYLVLYRPGPAWLTGKSVMEQPLKEHGKYMLSLYIKGSMQLAGPLTDNAGGAVLLEVANEAEAKMIVMNDPAVKSGVFVYEMHPWKLQPWEEFAKKAKAAAQ